MCLIFQISGFQFLCKFNVEYLFSPLICLWTWICYVLLPDLNQIITLWNLPCLSVQLKLTTTHVYLWSLTLIYILLSKSSVVVYECVKISHYVSLTLNHCSQEVLFIFLCWNFTACHSTCLIIYLNIYDSLGQHQDLVHTRQVL